MRRSAGRVMAVAALLLALGPGITAAAQNPAAPDRTEGSGPYAQLILRGATLIDGTGAPPRGPVDIVVENNRITNIVDVGFPGVPISPGRRPELAAGSRMQPVQ